MSYSLCLVQGRKEFVGNLPDASLARIERDTQNNNFLQIPLWILQTQGCFEVNLNHARCKRVALIGSRFFRTNKRSDNRKNGHWRIRVVGTNRGIEHKKRIFPCRQRFDRDGDSIIGFGGGETRNISLLQILKLYELV